MKYHLKSSLPKKYNQGETNLCWAACLFCALDYLGYKNFIKEFIDKSKLIPESLLDFAKRIEIGNNGVEPQKMEKILKDIKKNYIKFGFAINESLSSNAIEIAKDIGECLAKNHPCIVRIHEKNRDDHWIIVQSVELKNNNGWLNFIDSYYTKNEGKSFNDGKVVALRKLSLNRLKMNGWHYPRKIRRFIELW